MAKKIPPAEQKRRAKLVDEFGRLDQELPKAKRDRYDSIRKEIQGWADTEFPAGQPVMFEGTRFAAEVSAKPNKRVIRSMPLVWKLLGPAKFLAGCTIALKVLEQHLSPKQMAQAVDEKPNVGDRTVKIVERA